MKKKSETHLKIGRSLLDFIDRSPTPFHVVDMLEARIGEKGFVRLKEEDEWHLVLEGRYFVTRNNSSIVIFTTGSKFPESAGFKIICAYTDSPNLRLKPNPVYEKSGYVQPGRGVWGSPSFHLDRQGSFSGGKGGIGFEEGAGFEAGQFQEIPSSHYPTGDPS